MFSKFPFFVKIDILRNFIFHKNYYFNDKTKRLYKLKYTYKILGKKVIKFMDPVLRKTDKDSLDKINSWIKDQYLHPVESTHTYDEILNWFDKNNIEFINSVPELSIFEDQTENFFSKTNRASLFERILSQILMIFNRPGAEGAIFIFIGKKK